MRSAVPREARLVPKAPGAEGTPELREGFKQKLEASRLEAKSQQQSQTRMSAFPGSSAPPAQVSWVLGPGRETSEEGLQAPLLPIPDTCHLHLSHVTCHLSPVPGHLYLSPVPGHLYLSPVPVI